MFLSCDKKSSHTAPINLVLKLNFTHMFLPVNLSYKNNELSAKKTSDVFT